jgi:aerobic-type carbon monoxide dehydrogenase small subunit (CoxS/CutS family)
MTADPVVDEPVVRLIVNGRPCDVAVDPDTPLLYVLRNDLGLKGTRFGCGLGLCGACTVIIEGRARTSCDLPVSAVRGLAISTVEGLAHADGLDPLQDAFIDAGAGQCGFCLSGILMAARALLDVDPHPDDVQIREALEPNICRCGVQARVLRAIHRVVDQPGPCDAA